MKYIRDNFDFQEYRAELDQVGIAGQPFPFIHMNEPEDFPCMCETMIDLADKPGQVTMVHVFFGTADASVLLGTSRVKFEEEE